VWVSWRMDETYIKVKGQWYYLYRAVDKRALQDRWRNDQARDRSERTIFANTG